VRPEPLVFDVFVVVLVLFGELGASLPRVVNGGLRPDLSGFQVDTARAEFRVAFEDAGQLLQVDRERP
jgi:hypothetical protein